MPPPPVKKLIYPYSGYANIVDENGYVGEQFYNNGTNLYAYMRRGEDYSQKGLGQVAFIEPSLGKATIDGHEYLTTIIGNQEWICGSLGETFDFTYAFDGTQSPQYTYYGKSADNARFGCMYNGYAALRINSHLTDGWRVAENSDYNLLTAAMPQSYYYYLYGSQYWDNSGLRVDAYGLNLLPCGYAYGETATFYSFGSNLTLWTTAESGDRLSWRNFVSNNSGTGTDPKTHYFYVRLVRDLA